MPSRKTWFDRPGPELWVGFLNTFSMRHGEPHDAMSDGSELGRWAAGRGLGSATSFESRFSATTNRQMGELVRTRNKLRSVVECADEAYLMTALEKPANDMLGSMPGWCRLSGSRCELGYEDPSLRVLLPLVGHSLAEYIREGKAGRVKHCASEECILLFIDETRPGNRRWCDGNRCGNRHRVRQHSRRQA